MVEADACRVCSLLPELHSDTDAIVNVVSFAKMTAEFSQAPPTLNMQTLLSLQQHWYTLCRCKMPPFTLYPQFRFLHNLGCSFLLPFLQSGTPPKGIPEDSFMFLPFVKEFLLIPPPKGMLFKIPKESFAAEGGT
jgi:hypothetical protein